MNIRTAPLASCFCLLLATAGCVSIGRTFPSDGIKTIALGKTTQAQIETAYGKPYRTGIEDGDTTWTYVDDHVGVFSTPRTRDLFVRFNADGTVKSYAYNTNQ